MTIHWQLKGLLSITMFLSLPFVYAQDQSPDEQVNETPAGQEVEITEDNYRQFMELKDARQQRNIIPENVFKPSSGLQKLDKLPEESQKHLRNQLREIIVQGDQWQPGDEKTNYPYAPSQLAANNQSLQQQEAEAWGELVDSYHQREAEIYQNSARSQAAMAAENASPGSKGGGESHQKGDSSEQGTAQTGAAGQDKQPQSSKQENSADSYSPNAASDRTAQSKAGVSQNALEFLQGLGNQGNNDRGDNTGSSSHDGGQGELQAQAGQQGDPKNGKTEQGHPSSHPAGTEARTVAGTSQNAMEFLQANGKQSDSGSEGNSDASGGDGGEEAEPGQTEGQAGQQSGDPADSDSGAGVERTAGATQNALEFLQASNKQGDNAGEGNPDTTDGDSGQENGQAPRGTQAGQQGDGEEDELAAGAQSTGPSQDPLATSAGERPAGATQNAFQYLQTGEDNQGGEPANPSGTLSIGDLINAQGVGGPAASPPPAAPVDNDQQNSADDPDKGNDG